MRRKAMLCWFLPFLLFCTALCSKECRQTQQCVSTTVVNTSINCYGYESCYESSLESTASWGNTLCPGFESCCKSSIESANHIWCEGSRSCQSGRLEAQNNVYCYGTYGCQYSHILQADTTYCDGYQSCQYADISSKYVYGRGYYSLSSANIRSDGWTMYVYLDGFFSGRDATIHCYEDDYCFIRCSNNGCNGTYIECEGTCFIECDESQGHACPRSTSQTTPSPAAMTTPATSTSSEGGSGFVPKTTLSNRVATTAADTQGSGGSGGSGNAMETTRCEGEACGGAADMNNEDAGTRIRDDDDDTELKVIIGLLVAVIVILLILLTIVTYLACVGRNGENGKYEPARAQDAAATGPEADGWNGGIAAAADGADGADGACGAGRDGVNVFNRGYGRGGAGGRGSGSSGGSAGSGAGVDIATGGMKRHVSLQSASDAGVLTLHSPVSSKMKSFQSVHSTQSSEQASEQEIESLMKGNTELEASGEQSIGHMAHMTHIGSASMGQIAAGISGKHGNNGSNAGNASNASNTSMGRVRNDSSVSSIDEEAVAGLYDKVDTPQAQDDIVIGANLEQKHSNASLIKSHAESISPLNNYSTV